jgi:hypothetical protein
MIDCKRHMWEEKEDYVHKSWFNDFRIKVLRCKICGWITYVDLPTKNEKD